MAIRDSCAAAEDRLRQAQTLLRPNTLDQCVHALGQVVEILEEIAAGSARDWDPEMHLAFHRIRASAQSLQVQVEHGSRLIRGWMQLRFGAGYTRRGHVQLDEFEAARNFEA